MDKNYDIAIIGGGLVGASLACCLSKSGYKVGVFEKTPISSVHQPSYDDRGLALSLSSCRILNAAGIWSEIRDKCVPIKKIHVSDRGNFGIVRLNAEELGINAMGYVVIARALGQVLIETVKKFNNLHYVTPANVDSVSLNEDEVRIHLKTDDDISEISSKLVVVADGTNSQIREKAGFTTMTKDYDQTAIVSNITIEHYDEFTAYERFTSGGPLALLPLGGDRFASILCVPGSQAVTLLQMNNGQYLDQLEKVAGKRFGKFDNPGTRRGYPLRLIQSIPEYCNRLIMLGNSSHTIHPNGAQGFNLGLRDVAALAQCLIQERKGKACNPGSAHVIENYINLRRQDQQRIIRFTDGLAEMFYSKNPVKRIIRNTAMSLANSVPSIKGKFTRMAMGVDGRQPSLVRGLQLDQI